MYINRFLNLFNYLILNFFQFPASHHIIHKQHSPGGQSSRNTNLRVVIPAPMPPGINAEELTYAEVNITKLNF
jgi:hypothetical protein